MPDKDQTSELREQVAAAIEQGTPLKIEGGNSKSFYGRRCEGRKLDTTGHRGIINYQPKELVLTVRAGTPLSDVEQELSDKGQFLPFEPPHFSDKATIGGAVACGLSGPARAYTGSVRDFVLGMHIINGRSDVLHFGGEVMKNVAGYDVSRLMTGAFGTLGVILDTSFKVLPRPLVEKTLILECNVNEAVAKSTALPAQHVPLSASFHDGARLYLRLSRTETAVKESCKRIGGEIMDDDLFWTSVREQTHSWFQSDQTLWRLSLPAQTRLPDLSGRVSFEWGGALRWLHSDLPATELRQKISQVGGHATLMRAAHNESIDDVFHPLSGPLLKLHQRLKQSFDPQSIFNRGKMYAEF